MVLSSERETSPLIVECTIAEETSLQLIGERMVACVEARSDWDHV